MGVGKTTICKILKHKLSRCIFLDGDWCWDMSPFCLTEETKQLVLDNICYLLINDIRCSAFDNIVFCWVMHEQSIIDKILSRIDLASCTVKPISLICSEEALRARLQKDCDAGIRDADVIERSVARIPLYEKLDTIKVDVTYLTAEQAAERIRVL